LNAELEAEGAGRELAECIGDDPKRDKNTDEKDKDPEKDGVKLNPGEICSLRWVPT